MYINHQFEIHRQYRSTNKPERLERCWKLTVNTLHQQQRVSIGFVVLEAAIPIQLTDNGLANRKLDPNHHGRSLSVEVEVYELSFEKKNYRYTKINAPKQLCSVTTCKLSGNLHGNV